MITGSGRGLGRAYAFGAARAGAAVVVNDVDHDVAHETAEELRGLGTPVVAACHDVRVAEEAEALVATCSSSFGRLDGLVNNAGVYYESMPWEDDHQSLRQMVETNLLGAMYCGVAALRVMRARGEGSVINISSGACFGYRNIAAYGATKGALVSLTYSWALDLMDSNVRVNAVAPVAVTRMTHLTDQARRVVAHARGPEAIEPLVTFLLSDLAWGITGQFFHFDGRRLDILEPSWLNREAGMEDDAWDSAKLSTALDAPGILRPFGVLSVAPPRVMAGTATGRRPANDDILTVPES